jgi:predicted ester cyclase
MDLEATKQFAAIFFSGLPDLSHPLDELIAEGDKGAFRCRYEAGSPNDKRRSRSSSTSSRI